MPCGQAGAIVYGRCAPGRFCPRGVGEEPVACVNGRRLYRAEHDLRDARHGAITGLAATGGVITSAGFVLAGTFAALAAIPSTFSTELGFAVAFGILLDTIVVRLLLVTALNLDVGRWMWWPSKLARTPDPAPAELSQERASALAGV